MNYNFGTSTMVKFVPVLKQHAMNMYGSGGKGPHIHNLMLD
jgi:hypothetical protein